MDKKIEDYLPFYLGCEVWVIMSDGSSGVTILTHYHLKYPNIDPCPKEIKPLLRQLSDMSEEEEFEWSENGHKEADPMMAEAEATRYLLSKYFDLFGLIEAGLALDKTNQ